MTENEHTLKLKDAAELLGVHSTTVRVWKRRKGLPFRKPGRDLLFSRREVLEWQDRQRPASSQPPSSTETAPSKPDDPKP